MSEPALTGEAVAAAGVILVLWSVVLREKGMKCLRWNAASAAVSAGTARSHHLAPERKGGEDGWIERSVIKLTGERMLPRAKRNPTT